MLLRSFSSGRRPDLLSKFDLFQSAGNSTSLITSFGSFGLTFGNVSFKGPVIINQGRVFLWDVPQYGVGGISSKAPDVNDPNSPFHEWSWDAFNMFENVHPSPEILIIGSGAKLVSFPSIFRQNFQKLGIQLEVIDSKNACATYNLLSKEGRLVSCAILPPVPTSARTGKTLVELHSV
jgi:uncharacterized protein